MAKNDERRFAIVDEIIRGSSPDELPEIDSSEIAFTEAFFLAKKRLEKREADERAKQTLKSLKYKARPGRLPIESDDDEYEPTPLEVKQQKLLADIAADGGVDDWKIAAYLDSLGGGNNDDAG